MRLHQLPLNRFAQFPQPRRLLIIHALMAPPMLNVDVFMPKEAALRWMSQGCGGSSVPKQVFLSRKLLLDKPLDTSAGDATTVK